MKKSKKEGWEAYTHEKPDEFYIDNELNEDFEPPSKGNFEHPTACRKRRKWAQLDLSNKLAEPVATICNSLGPPTLLTRSKALQFTYIVDLDSYEFHKIIFHQFANKILLSPFFRFGILFLVMFNAIFIGLATIPSLYDRYTIGFKIIDQVIMSIFVFEIALKWIYDFRMFWKVGWNILDFVIVFMIGVTTVIPIFGSNSRALVVVRVTRAFRSLRTVSSLTSLSIVTRTVVKSGIDMGNILLVLIIFMLVMAIMGVILFELDGLDTRLFLNAFDAWFVLFICVTQDGWNTILDDFRKQPYFGLMSVYLIFGVSIGSFVFANLIVAVIVANLELSVRELRRDRSKVDNPLLLNYVSGTGVPIVPCMERLRPKTLIYRRQKPMELPPINKFSAKRLSNYVQLNVALEQNMLEAETIKYDLERIISVLLAISTQLEEFSDTTHDQNIEEGKTIMKEMKKIQEIIALPKDIFSRTQALKEIEKAKQKEAYRNRHRGNSMDTSASHLGPRPSKRLTIRQPTLEFGHHHHQNT